MVDDGEVTSGDDFDRIEREVARLSDALAKSTRSASPTMRRSNGNCTNRPHCWQPLCAA
jgi:hypothetical protein